MALSAAPFISVMRHTLQTVPVSVNQPFFPVVSPLIHMSFCPDKPILAGLSGGCAPCVLPVLAGRHDDANVICLTRRTVNISTSVLFPMYQRCKR